ncbi:hypothetical protein QTP88_005882 [Uroleucon formosanum]
MVRCTRSKVVSFGRIFHPETTAAIAEKDSLSRGEEHIIRKYTKACIYDMCMCAHPKRGNNNILIREFSRSKQAVHAHTLIHTQTTLCTSLPPRRNRVNRHRYGLPSKSFGVGGSFTVLRAFKSYDYDFPSPPLYHPSV